MGAMFVDDPIARRDHNFLSIHRTFGDDFATRRYDKALSPKLNSVATCGASANAIAPRHNNHSQSHGCVGSFPMQNIAPRRISFSPTDASRWQSGKIKSPRHGAQ